MSTETSSSSTSYWRRLPTWVDGLATLATVGVKSLTWLDGIHRLLPLPKEHEAIGWIFTLAMIALGIWLAILIRSARTENRIAFVSVCTWSLLLAGFLLFPALFWAVEQAWKHSPVEVADPIYKWGVPLVYSATFGALAAAFSLIFHRIAQALGWLQPDPHKLS